MAAASRANRLETLLYVGLLTPAILVATGQSSAYAGQLAANAFQPYAGTNYSAIQPGPFSLYSVNVGSLDPTQENEGFTEVGKKAAGFDLLTPSALQANLLPDIEPVVIGPGGQLYLTDGHHTFTALEDSIYGASNPTVFVNVIANYSNLTTSQFFTTLQSNNLLLPLNDGVPQTVNTATGAPIPTSLTGLTSDPYRGLEYSILKQKSSKLFTTTGNITGAAGASTPGLDKITGFYSDFLEAAAYRSANGGLGLPYLSPGDIALATQWNLNAASKTTLPNVAGTVTAAQLPGFILANSIVNNTVIGNATLAGGALDGNGTFTGITTINAGTASAPITIGTPNTGFIMELGSDRGGTVTLGGANTYTGGTTIIAGDLIIANDASLGASAPAGASIDPNNIVASVHAANGIIFNSLTEGAGTLTIGTTAGGGTGTFTTNRPIAVDGETATINLNGYLVSLTGPIASVGALGTGLGNATGESDLTIDDNSSNKGVLTLSGSNPLFYGNLIIGGTNTPTVRVTSDAALGNTTGTAASIGQVELNGGTLQAGASFAAPERNIFLAGGSNFDVDGFTTSWGTLSDVQRTLEILNSNTTTAGAATFNNFNITSTATLQLAGGPAGETVTFTNGIVRTGNATLIIQPTNATSLGTATDKLLSGTGAASLVHGIAPAYIVTNNGGSKGSGPYDFVTYGANGYVKATYGSTFGAGNVVALSGATTPAGSVSAFALNTEGKALTLGTNTLTLGDGSNPGGLILASGSAVTGGTLAFGSSEGVIWLSGSNPSISSKITGTNGLTFAGSGAVSLSTAANVSGLVSIDSGTVTLAGTNIFASDTAGVNLLNVKKSPAPSTLALTASNTLTALNSVGSNSSVTLSSGAALTLGDTTNNLSSTLSSTITETGAATAGALTFNGSGLFDLSGGSVTLASGSTVVANNSAQLRLATGAIGSAFGIVLNGTSELQLAQNGGGVLANTVSGTGDLRLIGGTLQITGTANTYSGGTFVETGSTLDITTANLPAINPNITDAGGLIVFDQTTNGTYAGVISDGKELGTGPQLSGSLDKDDSTGNNSGNVTLTLAQTYTGATTIEAGTLTLGAVNTLATSSGVDLGRIGGGATASLALAANNTVQALTSEASNTTSVTIGTNILTINTAATTTASFGGIISGAGSVIKSGAGTEVFTGANTYTGGTNVQAGLLAVTGAGTLGASTAPLAVSGGTLDLGGTTQAAGALTFAGGTIKDGTLDAASFGVQAGTLNAVFGGAGTLTKTGAATFVLSGANSYSGGTKLMSGEIEVGNNASLGTGQLAMADGTTLGFLTNGLTLANPVLFTGTSDPSIDTGSFTETLSNAITGAGALTKQGSGTLILTGASTYTGATTIAQGTLEVDGSIVSTTSIQSGATLSGSGSLGGLAVAGGATLAPGTGATFGTLNFAGPVAFAAGSFYNVKISPASNDLLKVSGATTISGGTVQALVSGFNFPFATHVTILTSTGGVGGQFSAATSTAAFLTPTLSYDPDDVFLTLTRNDTSFGAVGQTSNQRQVGGAIQAAANAFAAAPYNPNGAAVLNNLIGESAPQARGTYDMLSGEGLTGAQNLAFTANALFTSAIQDQSATYRDGGTASVSITVPDGPGPLAYAGPSPLRPVGPPTHVWHAWFTGFGGGETLQGNAALGTSAQSNGVGGGAVGVDDQVNDNILIGVAGGASDGTFSVPGRATSGEVVGGHGGVYSTATFGPGYIQSSFAYSGYDNTTRRFLSGFGALVGGAETGHFRSDEIRTRIEAGRRIEGAQFGGIGITPFVALEIAELWSRGFTEQGGPNLLGLNVPGQSATSVPGFVGARFDATYAIGNEMVLRPVLSLAYVHDFAPERMLQASLTSLPAATFIVDGARLASNAARIKLGGELDVTQNVAVFANFEGEFSGVTDSYAGKGGLRFGW